MDELCISWRQNLWLWTAVSRYTGQVLAWFVGSRSWDCLEDLWVRMPLAWKHRLIYTDGYGAYFAFFSAWQHRVCEKFDSGTATVEGVNHASIGFDCSDHEFSGGFAAEVEIATFRAVPRPNVPLEYHPIAGVQKHLGGAAGGARVPATLIQLEDEPDVADPIADRANLPRPAAYLIVNAGTKAPGDSGRHVLAARKVIQIKRSLAHNLS